MVVCASIAISPSPFVALLRPTVVTSAGVRRADWQPGPCRYPSVDLGNRDTVIDVGDALAAQTLRTLLRATRSFLGLVRTS